MAIAERYQGVGWLRLAFRPIRDMFVFSGRSTRTEVVAFFILGALANISIVTVIADDLLGLLLISMKVAWNFLWSFPWIALFVRRLHDQGRPGWWALLLAAPYAAILTMVATSGTLSPRGTLFDSLTMRGALFDWSPAGPSWIGFMGAWAMAAATILVLHLLPGTDGPNRYGPDPRLDPEPQASLT